MKCGPVDYAVESCRAYRTDGESVWCYDAGVKRRWKLSRAEAERLSVRQLEVQRQAVRDAAAAVGGVGRLSAIAQKLFREPRLKLLPAHQLCVLAHALRGPGNHEPAQAALFGMDE